MNNKEEILKQIDIENFIWIIYLGIILLCFISNDFEKQYYETNNSDAKESYRLLNIIIFCIVFLVYIYYFLGSYNSVINLKDTDSSNAKLFNTLNFVASLLVVIAGGIFLYIAVSDDDLTTEIAFS